MKCPTCSHDMRACGVGLHHCPQCGTLGYTGDPAHHSFEAPALVARCLAFEDACVHAGAVRINDEAAALWRTLGVARAIHPG